MTKVHAQVFDQKGRITHESAVAMQIERMGDKYLLNQANKIKRRTPMTTLDTLNRQRAELRAKLIRGY